GDKSWAIALPPPGSYMRSSGRSSSNVLPAQYTRWSNSTSISEAAEQPKECRQPEVKRAEGVENGQGENRFTSGWLHSRVERSCGRRFRGSGHTGERHRAASVLGERRSR